MDDGDSPVDLSKHHQSRLANLLPLPRVRGGSGMDEARDLNEIFFSFDIIQLNG